MRNMCIIIIMSLILLGCSIEKEPQCKIDSDCSDYIPYICVNNTCVSVDCRNKWDCNPYSFYDWRDCINNTCISYLKDCKRISVQDYHMKNPYCEYIDMCACKDWVVDSPEKKIIMNNSIQIIPERGHWEGYVIFEIKNDGG